MTIPNELARIVTGSKAYGLDTDESDLDLVVVFAAPPETFLSLRGPAKDTVQKTSETLDLTVHELGKYVNLLLVGNPTALETVFVDEECVLVDSVIYNTIRAHRDKVVSKRSLAALRGFAKSQIGKELKPKAFRHATRLLLAGRELAETGHLQVTVRSPQFIMETETLKDPQSRLSTLLEDFERAAEATKLPDEPDVEFFEELVLEYRLNMISWSV